MRVLFSINELSYKIFLWYDKICKEREKKFYLDKIECTSFKKIELNETSIGVDKFYFIS
jgi:hypothetical protein